MTTRRGFLAWAGSAGLVSRSAVALVPPKVLRVGLLTGSGEEIRPNIAALQRGLRELGYVEGKNIRWEMRFADGSYERLPSLAAELVKLRPDIIVVCGGTATDMAKKAILNTPLVSIAAADPIANGWVTNLARPGGNLTGVSSTSGETGAKRFELLLELAPKARRVVYFFNPGNPSFVRSPAQSKVTAEKYKRELNVDWIRVSVSTPADIDAGFVQMKRDRIDAVIVPPDSFLSKQHGQIAALAIANKMPSMGGLLSYAASGGLGGYGANIEQLYYQAAIYVDKIAKGAKPGDLAFARAAIVEFWVNKRTAGLIGHPIPEILLLRANRVIE